MVRSPSAARSSGEPPRRTLSSQVPHRFSFLSNERCRGTNPNFSKQAWKAKNWSRQPRRKTRSWREGATAASASPVPSSDGLPLSASPGGPNCATIFLFFAAADTTDKNHGAFASRSTCETGGRQSCTAASPRRTSTWRSSCNQSTVPRTAPSFAPKAHDDIPCKDFQSPRDRAESTRTLEDSAAKASDTRCTFLPSRNVPERPLPS